MTQSGFARHSTITRRSSTARNAVITPVVATVSIANATKVAVNRPRQRPHGTRRTAGNAVCTISNPATAAGHAARTRPSLNSPVRATVSHPANSVHHARSLSARRLRHTSATTVTPAIATRSGFATAHRAVAIIARAAGTNTSPSGKKLRRFPARPNAAGAKTTANAPSPKPTVSNSRPLIVKRPRAISRSQ